MQEMIASIYVTLAPAIFAGILNMVWVRSGVLRQLNVPMDRGRRLRDGRRLFGDHKTWKGFLGMIVLGALSGWIWGALLKGRPWEELDLLYRSHANTPAWSALSGSLLGLGYALAELPNSFLKRRLDIAPGKNPKGIARPFFVFLDQADSVLGCLLILRLFSPYGLRLFILGIFFGAATHIALNMLLYFLKLRKNMF